METNAHLREFCVGGVGAGKVATSFVGVNELSRVAIVGRLEAEAEARGGGGGGRGKLLRSMRSINNAVEGWEAAVDGRVTSLVCRPAPQNWDHDDDY